MKKIIDKQEVKNRGPEPERVKLAGDWEVNIKKALQKKRPVDGFPKEKKKA